MSTAVSPYPEMKASGVTWIGNVPNHWNVCRTKSLLSRNDSGVWGSDFDDQGTIVLRSTEQTASGEWNLIAPARRRLSPSEYAACRLDVGDLLVTKSSGSQLHIGKTTIVTREVADLDCCFSNFMQRLRVNGKAIPRFLWYALNGTMGRSQLAYYSDTTTGLANLNAEIIGNVTLAVPPSYEQDAIVRFLDYADRGIQRYIRAKQQLIALLEEQKQAVIHQAVTGQIDVRTVRPYESYKNCSISWLRHVPTHWAVRRIGQLARVGNGSTPSRSNLGYWNGGTFPWLNSSCVNELNVVSADQFVTEQAIRECHLPRVPPGSVLVGITGEGKTRGRATILRIEATTNQHVVFIIPESTEVSTGMLQMILTAAYTELRTISKSSGSTKSALTCEDIGRFRIVVPPMTEQDIIVSYVRRRIGDIDRVIELSNRMIVLLKEYRTVVVRDVVTGKLDVRKT